jgi:hypothetical protein
VHVGHVLLLEVRDGHACKVIPQQSEKGFERAGILQFDAHESTCEPLGVGGNECKEKRC